jgi:predicted nucleic acid-binding protein
VTLVVDASVAIKWLIEEAGTGAAEALRGRHLVAPQLIRVEVANVLRTIAARGLAPPERAVELLALFQSAPLDIVDADDALERRALDLAMALAHPVYDCLYLALAERMGAPMVTADTRFLRALAGTPFDALAHPLGA